MRTPSTRQRGRSRSCQQDRPEAMHPGDRGLMRTNESHMKVFRRPGRGRSLSPLARSSAGAVCRASTLRLPFLIGKRPLPEDVGAEAPRPGVPRHSPQGASRGSSAPIDQGQTQARGEKPSCPRAASPDRGTGLRLGAPDSRQTLRRQRSAGLERHRSHGQGGTLDPHSRL